MDRNTIKVAPLAGAWIEISMRKEYPQPIKSLPSRERGLKFENELNDKIVYRRSPRGSVD